MITSFGEYLKKFRIDTDMTLKDMAKGIGVSSSYLSAVEKGHKGISDKVFDTLYRRYLSANVEGDREKLYLMAMIARPILKLNWSDKKESTRKFMLYMASKYEGLTLDQISRIRNICDEKED